MTEAPKFKKNLAPKIVMIIGLILILVGMAQAVYGPENKVNLFIMPGALMMLLGAVMPSKKLSKPEEKK